MHEETGMRTQTPEGRTASRVAVALGLLLGFTTACQDHWESPHIGVPLTTRPECPVHWGDSIPWLRSDDQAGHTRSNQVFYAQLPPGGIPGPGPITDIPEFHDCQRFLSRDGAAFDSLFAIFASFKLDSITRSLPWDSVSWSSSKPAVATVDQSGIVTGVSAGEVTITATSHGCPSCESRSSRGEPIGRQPRGNARRLGGSRVTVSRAVTVVQQEATPTSAVIDAHGSNPETVSVGQARQVMAMLGEPLIATLSVATIYAYLQAYPTLGIEPNFNCLFLYFDATRRLRARMVPVNDLGAQIDACLNLFDPTSRTGKELAVVRTEMLTSGGAPRPTYPPVARWDRDPNRSVQTIGIACGDAWCTIGEPDASGNLTPSPVHLMPSATNAASRAVVEIKGWHDEQLLAVPVGPGMSEMRPSSLRGMVIPQPGLKDTKWSQNGGGAWETVAHVAMTDLSGGGDLGAVEYYRNNFGLEAADLGPTESMNELSYCYGRYWQCGASLTQKFKCHGFGSLLGRSWFTKIRAARVNTSKTLCMVRRTHPPFTGTIPATARWRWILSDDTIWTECMQGCCETQAGS
jgi:hypothetical protein